MSIIRAPHTNDETAAYLTTHEAAAYLGISVWSVRRYAGDGRLRGFRVGQSKRGQLRFRRADLDALLTPTTDTTE